MSQISRRGFMKTALAMGALPLVANESKKENTLKVIHITDSHMDLADTASVEAMELMAEFINKEYKDLDFVLFGGDNFNNNVAGNKDALKFKEIIDKLHCPALLVRGNKESSPKPKGDSINLDEFKNMFLEDKSLLVDGRDWLLEKNGYLILGLDSCIENANNGLYTKETIAFAKKALQSKKPTIILNHHPYTNYWKGTEANDIHKYVLNNTDEVQKELFSFSNLILTLSGHKHIDSVKELHGTKAIVTRGFVRPLDLDMYPMRYVEINNVQISEKLIYTS
ncbi:MAG: Icc protein [Sulfurimonas sp.]|jgi:Icc protein|uniref:metallophosphoesterase n=1 Tax=Sulfurimonas sp. TaxID=2022749 RepID=UPI0039E576E3